VAQPAPSRTTPRTLTPVAAPSAAETDATAERRLIETLARISRTGGSYQFAPPPKRYGFPGGTHLNSSQEITLNLWRFKLTTTARDVLDHMTVTHDEHGIVAVTQSALAAYFECSQAKISRALGQLSRHHFVWKARRGQYQLNPRYAYRFSSRKHAILVARLGKVTLKEHAIVIPETRS
jgi:CRP-like cAMP-binding protein